MGSRFHRIRRGSVEWGLRLEEKTRFDSGKISTTATHETSQSAWSGLVGFVTAFRGAREPLLSRVFL